MSFSESGGTITQTGTDDTTSFITGMQGITGVTVSQYGFTLPISQIKDRSYRNPV